MIPLTTDRKPSKGFIRPSKATESQASIIPRQASPDPATGVYRGMPGAVVTFPNIPKIKKGIFIEKGPSEKMPVVGACTRFPAMIPYYWQPNNHRCKDLRKGRPKHFITWSRWTTFLNWMFVLRGLFYCPKERWKKWTSTNGYDLTKQGNDTEWITERFGNLQPPVTHGKRLAILFSWMPLPWIAISLKANYQRETKHWCQSNRNTNFLNI